MLKDIWDNAPTTAAKYIGVILFLYLLGLLFLLIHSIKQRTGTVTCYDIYLELSDIFRYLESLFGDKPNKKEGSGSQKIPNEDPIKFAGNKSVIFLN